MEMHKIDGLGPHRDPSTRVRKSESSLDRLAALKARVAAATNLSKAKRDPRDDGGKANERVAHIKWDGDSESSQSRGPIATKYHRTSVSSNRHVGQAEERKPGINPYYTPTAADHSAGSRQRVPRRLVFNQKGRYIQQANALRRQAALESMKKRIAEQTRKVGINEDLDVEKNFVVDEPPKIEWWDEGLVSGTRYEQMDDPEALKIHTSDTIITELIQHPVALEPPQDRQKPDAKAMFLTSKEQAKIRRQSRRAELKERQAKVRLGLLPPPPSKVKKGNLMLVLGDVAVKDPTAVEARVNREIAERHQKHVESNEIRKLSKEQKNEKLSRNQQKDDEKGIKLLVFKISSLANGQHRYKIGMNATQLALSGTCIMHPKFSLVIVEGGSWSIYKYKKLMLNRIDWSENSLSTHNSTRNGMEREWLQAEDETGTPKDMSLNDCKLVFEGEQKARAFRKWSSKVCETDAEARETLARAKMENFWSLAKGIS